MTFAFRFRSGPDWLRVKEIIKDYPNQELAKAFSEGLSAGGAGEIFYEDLNPPPKKEYYCVICQQNPVDVENGYDTCPDCC